MIRLLFIIILLLAGVIDAATRKIYNLFPLAITVISIWNFVQNPDALLSGIIGFFALSIPMLLLAVRCGGLGGGDIKLTAACGLFLGTDALLIGFLTASLLALAVYFIRWMFKKQGAHEVFAFGPYLATGFIMAALIA